VIGYPGPGSGVILVGVITDLVNEHRGYEHVYQELGFQKAVERARFEKELL